MISAVPLVITSSWLLSVLGLINSLITLVVKNKTLRTYVINQMLKKDKKENSCIKNCVVVTVIIYLVCMHAGTCPRRHHVLLLRVVGYTAVCN